MLNIHSNEPGKVETFGTKKPNQIIFAALFLPGLVT